MLRLPLRGAVVCQGILLGGLVLLHPQIRRAVPPLVSAIGLMTRGELSGTAERLRPHAGEGALGPLPHELVTIARERRLADFALSPTLTGQPEILQRVTEGAWPIRLSTRSRDLFVPSGEVLPAPCVRRHAGQLVDYARCG